MTNIIKNWNSKTIRIRSDRYVSLTDMAQATGKRVNNWLRLDSTKSYLAALSRSTHLSADHLVRVNESTGRNEDRGTWGHPKVSIRFAQWCNDEFAVWVDTQIDELMTTGKVELASTEPKRAVSYYTDRIVDLPKRLSCPSGYWAVIEECGHLLLDVERAGYPIDQYDLLDGSVGRRYSDFRKANKVNNPTAIARYKVDACPNPVPITVYPYSEMGIFKQWLKEVYMVNFLPKYLQDKYGKLAKV